MKRFRLASTIVAGLFVGALVASCSRDNGSPDPVAPTSDELQIGGASLAGGGWSPTVAAAAAAAEANGGGNKVSICHSGNGKNYTQINVSAQGARAHLGDPESGKGGHAADFRVSSNTPCPPPASTPGQVEICKVGGAGVAVGTNFTFTLASGGSTKTVTVAAGAGPNGTCAAAGGFQVGAAVTVTEGAQAGVSTTAIVVSPIGAQQGTPDLGARSVTIIAGTGTTRITFTNQAQGATGTLVICKVGGTGVTAGTNFTFGVAGQTQTVAAGAGPNGTCGSALTVGAGTVTVTETAVAGTVAQSIAGTPAVTNLNLAGRSASILITAGQESRITFTNVASTATGTLVICKVGGSGIAAGTNFSFSAGGQTQTVAAGAAPNGTCGTPLTVTVGELSVSETAVANTAVSAITGTPATPTNINLLGRAATVVINAGQETRITFTNVAATTGTLVICKIGGTGVAAGTNFTFTVAGQTQTVAAGAAPNGTCGAPLILVTGSITVAETAVAGTSVSAITGTPALPTNINLAARSATVAINAGQETRITFTNVAP